MWKSLCIGNRGNAVLFTVLLPNKTRPCCSSLTLCWLCFSPRCACVVLLLSSIQGLEWGRGGRRVSLRGWMDNVSFLTFVLIVFRTCRKLPCLHLMLDLLSQCPDKQCVIYPSNWTEFSLIRFQSTQLCRMSFILYNTVVWNQVAMRVVSIS